MVGATKSQKTQHNDDGRFTVEDLKNVLGSIEDGHYDRSTGFQIKAAVKKIRSSLAQYNEGKATLASVGKGLEGIKELSALTGKHKKEIGALVDRFNTTFLESESESNKEREVAGTRSRKKPSRIKKYVATGALGLALLGVPVKSYAQKPAMTYTQSQSINTQKKSQTVKAKQHLSETERYEKVQHKYYEGYQDKVEQNIESIMGKNLSQSRIEYIVNTDFKNMKELQTYQEGQMKQLLDKIASEQADPQMAELIKNQNLKIEAYEKIQQNYYNEYQDKVEQNIKSIMNNKNLTQKRIEDIVDKDFENLKALQADQGGQMGQLLDVFAKQRQDLANRERESIQQQQQIAIRNREKAQDAIREQKIRQEEAVKRIRTQQMINTGMSILGEALWLSRGG